MVSIRKASNRLDRQTRFEAIDIRNARAFPDLEHRFSRLMMGSDCMVLERDPLGENPLHYCVDTQERQVIVGSNISDIKSHVESHDGVFGWDRVRAVSNNTRVTFDNRALRTISPKEEEISLTLQEDRDTGIDCRNIAAAGHRVRDLLQQSVEQRLSTVNEDRVGLLLSGGLDSMSIGCILSGISKKELTAFTLKVDENERDVLRSREVASDFGLVLTEVKVSRGSSGISISIQKYSPGRKLIYEAEVENDIDVTNAVFETLRISASPKKDNMFCAIAMYLIGKAISAEGISVVFCGEGPNEMINDYGFDPSQFGYGTSDKGDVDFRKALTFGFKKTDLQLGRGGLPKHAVARMGKIFASYGIRLESPYFEMEIARILTEIPHVTSYDRIKQVIMKEAFAGERLERFIEGTTKEKFQDGSGISGLFRDFSQNQLLEIFEEIYGIRKVG